nr:MAG TPA: AntA/AntB antirepressor [Caudoviricetes sp.]
MQLPQILSNQTIGAEINSADARELHAFLNSEQEFANWIKNRITQYGFLENQDYIIKTTYTGRRPRKEYFITLNMAKELCMVENNAKGKEARQYFIKCEQELQALKFSHYVNRIADLNAVLIDNAKRHKRRINGYKSQLKQHNEKIVVLKHELEKASNPRPSDPIYAQIKAERDYYKERYKKLSQSKDETIILNLAKIQKELEKSYTAIGAVMAYADGDDYFIKKG